LEAAVGRTSKAIERLADVKLYALVDGRESEAALVSLVTSLIAGGVDAIQLRDKRLSDRELVGRATLLSGIINRNPAPSPAESSESERTGINLPLLIINDRPDIAAAVGADGVHLGQDDMRVTDARAILGTRKLIGVSTHSIEQARAAVLDGANYIGVGPTFPSNTKTFDSFPGLELLRQVAAEIRLPAFAIGGIDCGNIGEVKAAGFTRAAVSSAVASADDPAGAVQGLCAALTG
jgi:thiamine-phosphate pyrophosphorylase